MTELERELLAAFDSLQKEYRQQHSDWAKGYKALQTMFERTSAETQDLREQVESLTALVENLSKQLKR